MSDDPARRRVLVLALVLVAFIACAPAEGSPTAQPGEPLPGLRQAELARFYAGRALFDKVFTPDEGLGPLFNENQCSACHTMPASGGTTGFERVVRTSHFEGPGSCDLLARAGGENVRSQATPRLKAHGIDRQSIPDRATEIGRFSPTSLFGLGLVEAIPDDAILARADPDDADGDGISGRAGRTSDGRLARFGRKAEFPTIGAFAETALRLEMGLTTPSMPDEGWINGMPVPQDADPVPEPEVDDATVNLLTTFVRFLAPPARSVPRSPAHRDTIAAGQRLFGEIGCTGCHTPSMRTGPSDVPALDRKTVHLYSDLLLHDMGPALADVCGLTAAPAEVRTEMLMGLRHRDRLLHDGRTSDLREAILTHGGEAQKARDAFARLPWLRQELVLRFLQAL